MKINSPLRWFQSSCCGLVLILALIFATERVAAGDADPIMIGDRLELFVDDHLLETVSGVTLRMHTPERRSLEGFPVGAHFSTVILDGDIYRLYYRFNDITHYAESDDGVHWVKPELDIVEGFEGRRNAIFSEKPFSHNFSPFIDTRPGIPDDERYKAVAGSRRAPRGAEGLYSFVSGDGLNWRKLSNEPFLRHDPEIHEKHAFDSQNVAFWSQEEQQYVLYYRHWNAPPANIRSIGRAVSADFRQWTDQADVFETPNLRADYEHLYTNQTSPYFRAPHIYIALPTRYVYGRIKGEPVLNEEGKIHNVGSTDVILMSSRAGAMGYDRTFKEAFIRPGVDPVGWANRANYVALNVVPTGPHEMSIYHRNGDRYVLRTDGFASLHAGNEQGGVTSRPLIFSGSQLVLNLSTSLLGQVRVEVQDADGKPLPGLSLRDCTPITDDAIERVVAWGERTDLSDYAGTPVRLRFVLRDSDIYSFRFREIP